MGDTHEHYIFQFLYKFNLYNMEHPPLFVDDVPVSLPV